MEVEVPLGYVLTGSPVVLVVTGTSVVTVVRETPSVTVAAGIPVSTVIVTSFKGDVVELSSLPVDTGKKNRSSITQQIILSVTNKTFLYFFFYKFTYIF